MARIATLGLLGGFLESNPITPGFLFFQSGGGGVVEALFQPPTGVAFPIYSIYTGLTSVLNLISGANNDFFFSNSSQMFIGRSPIPYGSGQLNINWTNNGSATNRAGIMINQSGASYDAAPDPYLVARNYSLGAGTYSEYREFVGPGATDVGGNPVEYSSPCYTALANTYSNSTYRPSASLGADTPAKWGGWKWSVQGGSDVYRKFGVFNNYIDIGTVLEDGSIISNGGDNFIALRRSVNNPNSSTAATAAIYYASDSNLKIFTSREISLGPNISGITQLAYHQNVWTTAFFDGTRHILNDSHNGKKVRISSLGPVVVTGTVANGFTCECHVRIAGTISFSGSSPLTRRSRGNLYTGAGQYAVVNLARDSNDLIIWGDLI